jgi:hypothetical protein
MASTVERWNWFESVSYSGKWIVRSGYAEVGHSADGLHAVLLYSQEIAPHYYVDITEEEPGTLCARVRSPNQGVKPFTLQGTAHSFDNVEGNVSCVILTDGCTVLGLTKGPRSDEANLA